MSPSSLAVGILVLLVTPQALSKRKTVFKTFSDPLLGQMNVTFAFQHKNYLTTQDKQHILDMHNVLRLRLATGKETNSWDGATGRATMPTAANMQAMEWDDKLAKYAQDFASQCRDGHSQLGKFKAPRYKGAMMAENLSGDVTYLEKDMYGEVRWWNYAGFKCMPNQQCGHYENFAGWAMSNVGCGWQVCPPKNNVQKIHLVCVYGGYTSTTIFAGQKRKPHEHEYKKGKPCSACLQGWDFCMGGGLCATKAQCDSDRNNKCKCLHDKRSCLANKGTFDRKSCTCTCPPNKMGINCAQPCANEFQSYCGMQCTDYASNAYYCQKVCGGCGQSYGSAYKYWFVDRKLRNKKAIKVRHIFEDPDERAKQTDMTKKPMYGKCKNEANSELCEILFVRGYCKDHTYGQGIRKGCPLSCGKCPEKADASTFSSPGDFGTFDFSKIDFGSEVKPSGDQLKELEGIAGLDLTGFTIVGRRRRR